MKNLNKILLRILIIAVFLIISNLIYKHVFLESDLQEHSEIINKLRKVNDTCKLVYFGESSNASVRGDDINKSSISEFIAQYYPSLNLGTVDKGAAHSGIYKVYIQQFPEDSQVETIIITLNLRSFNAGWIYSDLETPLQKSIVLLNKYPPLYSRFLLSFKGYDNKTEEERTEQFKTKWKNDILVFPYEFPHNNVVEWDNYMAQKGIFNPDGSRNQELTELACHYIKAYAFLIDTLTNPRIKDFDEIVKIGKKRKWNIVFNLLAENIEKAKGLVGKDLIYLMNQNRNILVNRYTKMGVIVVDNLELISDNEFIDQNWTTEHYAEKGRKRIAENTAENMKILYPEEYTDVIYKNEKVTEFFIKCEESESWGQMHTLSSNKAFSGITSSKTGNGEDFSVTFEWGIKNIPDTIQSIDVKCKIYQTVKEHDAKLAIEVNGSDIKNIWHNQKITSFTQKINSWQELSYTYRIPENLLSGEIIKIYIYNPTKHTIYIDDIEISFK